MHCFSKLLSHSEYDLEPPQKKKNCALFVNLDASTIY